MPQLLLRWDSYSDTFSVHRKRKHHKHYHSLARAPLSPRPTAQSPTPPPLLLMLRRLHDPKYHVPCEIWHCSIRRSCLQDCQNQPENHHPHSQFPFHVPYSFSVQFSTWIYLPQNPFHETLLRNYSSLPVSPPSSHPPHPFATDTVQQCLGGLPKPY